MDFLDKTKDRFCYISEQELEGIFSDTFRILIASTDPYALVMTQARFDLYAELNLISEKEKARLYDALIEIAEAKAKEETDKGK